MITCCAFVYLKNAWIVALLNQDDGELFDRNRILKEMQIFLENICISFFEYNVTLQGKPNPLNEHREILSKEWERNTHSSIRYTIRGKGSLSHLYVF
jgi:hypothetical protein